MLSVMEPETGSPGSLLKEQLAARLRDAIVGGRLVPGQRVVEGHWAREFGVAQASVREAINLLIGEGFLTKDAGRSARVTKYTAHDVLRIYQVRGVLEGLAAQLVTAHRTDFAPIEKPLLAMEAAIARGDMQELIRQDLQFHLTLCELSGNQYLVDAARRLLIPLFAFVLLQVIQSGQGPEAWGADLPRHRRMIDIMREGNPAVAGHYVQHCVSGFVASAYEVWDNVGGSVEAHKAGRGKKRPA
jgi:DNA-binding GntR family transcriptional regulator